MLRNAWLVFAAAVIAAFSARAAPGAETAGAPTEAGEGSKWEKLFADEDWYKQAEGKEQVFQGKLEAVKNAGGPSTLMRTSYYRLGKRTIYTGARKLKTLDRLVDKNVEIRG